MKALTRVLGRIFGTLRAEWQQLYNRYFGHIERFEGNAQQICQQILDRLWSGDFYRTSLGHFDFFWMRDFGTVAESLSVIGYRKHVLSTLRWALLHYRSGNVITTCIDKNGNCFDAPGHAVDTLPWLLHSLVVSGYELNKAEHHFLVQQLEKYSKKYLDATGHIRPMKFAEMRDAVMYDRSAYAVTLVGRMAICVQKLGLEEGFKHLPELYQTELLENYWNGAYFNADRVTKAFSAECALFPFFLGVIDDKYKAFATVDYISEKQLNKPFPLIYTNDEQAFSYHFWMTAPFMPHYEGHTLWSWHGLYYLHILRRYNYPTYEQEKSAYAKGMIEQHKTFPEMLNADGSWYYSPIYRGDPGMVWVALYLELEYKIPLITKP